jgi:hypothetical protein
MTARARKEAAKQLGVALQAKFRTMNEATTNAEVEIAAIDLGNCFNENIEFICWALKEYGGVKQMPFLAPDRPKPMKDLQPPANDLPDMPDILKMTVPAPVAECTCPVLEAGIIGRDKHMTSCPRYEP